MQTPNTTTTSRRTARRMTAAANPTADALYNLGYQAGVRGMPLDQALEQFRDASGISRENPNTTLDLILFSCEAKG